MSDAAMFAALAAAAAGGGPPPDLEGMPMESPYSPVMPFDILTPSQAAAYLQVDEETVLREAEAGRLPGQKLGGQWRFLRLAIAEWLRSGERAMSEAKKQSMLSVVGAFKDDDTLEPMVAEIYRQRKQNPVGG